LAWRCAGGDFPSHPARRAWPKEMLPSRRNAKRLQRRRLQSVEDIMISGLHSFFRKTVGVALRWGRFSMPPRAPRLAQRNASKSTQCEAFATPSPAIRGRHHDLRIAFVLSKNGWRGAALGAIFHPTPRAALGPKKCFQVDAMRSVCNAVACNPWRTS